MMDVYAKILILLVIFLLLILVIFGRIRLSRLEKKLDSMVKESRELMKLVLFHFETKKKKKDAEG